MQALDYLLARLKEGTTWAGIFTTLAGIGVSIPAEIGGYLTTIGMAGAGLALVLRTDKG